MSGIKTCAAVLTGFILLGSVYIGNKKRIAVREVEEKIRRHVRQKKRQNTKQKKLN